MSRTSSTSGAVCTVRQRAGAWSRSCSSSSISRGANTSHVRVVRLARQPVRQYVARRDAEKGAAGSLDQGRNAGDILLAKKDPDADDIALGMLLAVEPDLGEQVVPCLVRMLALKFDDVGRSVVPVRLQEAVDPPFQGFERERAEAVVAVELLPAGEHPECLRAGGEEEVDGVVGLHQADGRRVDCASLVHPPSPTTVL